MLRTRIPASLFAFVLATVMVGSGVLFDRMAAVVPDAPLRVALLDRVPPSRVEPVGLPGQAADGAQLTLVAASPAPMRLALHGPSAHDNAPVRAPARRGDKKKQVQQPVFGPQLAPDEAGAVFTP